MLKTVSQSTPTNQYENVGTGVQGSPVLTTIRNPFTEAMNVPNMSGVNTDMTETASSHWNTDVFPTDPSNQSADIFQTDSSNQNADIFQTDTSNWKTDIFQTDSSNWNADMFQTDSSNWNADIFQADSSNRNANIFQADSSNWNADIFQTDSSNRNADIFQADSSNRNADIFQATSSYENTDISQTASSSRNIAALSRAPPTSPQVDLFQPLPFNVETPTTESRSSSAPFEIFQDPQSSQEKGIFQKPKPEVPKKPNALKLRLLNGTPFGQGTPSPVSSVLAQQMASPVSASSVSASPVSASPVSASSWRGFFQDTPSATSDTYQTPSSTRDDLFNPLQNKFHDPSWATSSSDLFKTPSASFSLQSTPISQVLSSVQTSHTPGNPFYPIPNGKPSFGKTEEAGETATAERELNVLLTTPEGTEHDVFQNTPIDVRNSAFSSPSQEVEASTSTPSEFYRSKPLPRVPSKKPASTRAPMNTVKQESVSPVEQESPSEVNIEFTGEERCVEDWPEDSPRFSSNWRPSGTLRLRRESILEKDDGSNGGDRSGKKMLKKLALSISTRRRSKDKLLDDLKPGDGHSVHQRSERSDTSSPVQELKEGLLIDVFSSDNGEEQNPGEDSKSAKKLKFKGSRVLRRKSKEKLIDTTENHPVLELYEGPVEEKAGSVSSTTSPKIPDDGTQDEFASQKKKNLKKRLSNLHRRTMKNEQVLRPNTDDHSLHQDFKDVAVTEAPVPYRRTTTWHEKAQEMNMPEDLFGPHSGLSKDTELHANHKEQDYYGMDLQDGKVFLDEDVPKRDADHHEEEGPHVKKKNKKKKSIKITVPRLTWKDYTNNNHPYGDSPGLPNKDYYLPEGAKGTDYESSEAMRRDYYSSATPKSIDQQYDDPSGLMSSDHYLSHRPKERDRFPTVGESPEFPFMGNVDSAKNEYGTLSSPSLKEDYVHPSLTHKGTDLFMADEKHGDQMKKMEDCKPKKPSKFGVQLRRKSKDKYFEEGSNWKSGQSDYQPSPQFKSDPMEDEFFHEDADVFMEGRQGRGRRTEEDYGPKYLKDHFPDKHTVHQEDHGLNRELDAGKKKKSRKFSIPNLTRKNQKSKSQQYEDPPGATSSDYYLSDAAKVEWTSSQMDVRRSCAEEEEEEERLEGLPEEDEGDTDSLMEWWNTVEMWDEVPSDGESTVKEEETKSFTQMADRVHRGLRVFNKVFTEQAEVLYQHALILHGIADDLSTFHHRAKVGSITGGTTMAVGGAAAIAGLALAPLTFGASLVVSAVGLGVVTAGGITSASAAISDRVHDLQDRKKIEVVAGDYLTRLNEVARCLGYVREGMGRLARHPLLRRNNYYASSDWDVRRALQMVSLVREPADRAADVAERGTATLSGLFKHMDHYFVDKGGKQELRKTCKKEATTQVHSVATILQEVLQELNTIREQMLDAYGNI